MHPFRLFKVRSSLVCHSPQRTLDPASLSPQRFRQSFDFLSPPLSLPPLYSPINARQVILVDAPTLFSGTWSLAQGMLSDMTKEKVVFTPLEGVKGMLAPVTGDEIANWIVVRPLRRNSLTRRDPLTGFDCRVCRPVRPPSCERDCQWERKNSTGGGGGQQAHRGEQVVDGGPGKSALAAVAGAGGARPQGRCKLRQVSSEALRCAALQPFSRPPLASTAACPVVASTKPRFPALLSSFRSGPNFISIQGWADGSVRSGPLVSANRQPHCSHPCPALAFSPAILWPHTPCVYV